jgi:hypothetical protein
MSAAGRPRKPWSNAAPLTSAIIASASERVMGAASERHIAVHLDHHAGRDANAAEGIDHQSNQRSISRPAIVSSGRGASPLLRRISRSNAFRSARSRRSAKNTAVFIAATLMPSSLARRSTSVLTERGSRSG